MFFHGAKEDRPSHKADFGDDQNVDDSQPMDNDDDKQAGDGMHHHEIHEDEGGGFHSKHTDPDGNVEHGEHATYEDAKADQDAKFGHGDAEEGDEDPDNDDGLDMDASDVAGSYGRAADCK